MSRDSLVIASKEFFGIVRKIRVVIDVGIERHLVDSGRSVRIRFGKRPTVVCSLTNPEKGIGRMVIDVSADPAPVIIASSTRKGTMKRVTQFIPSIDSGPKLIGSGHKP